TGRWRRAHPMTTTLWRGPIWTCTARRKAAGPPTGTSSPIRMERKTPMHDPGPKLDGKRALVTGGASGIGAATARLLTDLGARVVLTDLDGARAAQAVPETGAVGHVTGDVA